MEGRVRNTVTTVLELSGAAALVAGDVGLWLAGWWSAALILAGLMLLGTSWAVSR